MKFKCPSEAISAGIFSKSKRWQLIYSRKRSCIWALFLLRFNAPIDKSIKKMNAPVEKRIKKKNAQTEKSVKKKNAPTEKSTKRKNAPIEMSTKRKNAPLRTEKKWSSCCGQAKIIIIQAKQFLKKEVGQVKMKKVMNILRGWLGLAAGREREYRLTGHNSPAHFSSSIIRPRTSCPPPTLYLNIKLSPFGAICPAL